ncbi:MAG: amino acid ABC transporter permease [Spirochaetales bacterium]|nr:amino acid ABC transporter permease [Spirochaetales bacterium]
MIKLKNLFLQGDDHPVGNFVKTLNIIIAAIILILFFYITFVRLTYDFHWDSVWKYRSKFVQGFMVTLGISLVSLFMSLVIGTILAAGQRTKVISLHMLSRMVVEIIRGTPFLVQILVFFYVVADAFGFENRFLVGAFILSLFSGAYISEMIRAGIESVGSSQLESARSLGLTKLQIYLHVVVPQVIKRVLPSLAGQFASLIKDSSLLSIIAVREFTMNAQEVNAFTYSTLESYFPLAIGYLLLTFPISLFSRYLEKRYHYES